MFWKDLNTGVWKDPDPALMWGGGHVCVFPEGADRPLWVPERAVRHCHGPGGPGGAPDENAETDALC